MINKLQEMIRSLEDKRKELIVDLNKAQGEVKKLDKDYINLVMNDDKKQLRRYEDLQIEITSLQRQIQEVDKQLAGNPQLKKISKEVIDEIAQVCSELNKIEIEQKKAIEELEREYRIKLKETHNKYQLELYNTYKDEIIPRKVAFKYVDGNNGIKINLDNRWSRYSQQFYK